MKKEIIESLQHLISINVIGDKQFDSRYKGFIGELEFNIWFKKNRPHIEVFTGGFFLPLKDGNSTLTQPVYFTVTKDNAERYCDIYQRIARLKCIDLYFIQWESTEFSSWKKIDVMGTGIEIPVPIFKVQRYDQQLNIFVDSEMTNFLSNYLTNSKKQNSHVTKDKEYYWSERLEHYDASLLLDIYVQRLVFDGFIGVSKHRGIPSDIDFILFSTKRKEFQILEIKEKDLSKKEPKGFGMDVRRIDDLMKIDSMTGMHVYYIVREVDNQYDRNFVQWRILPIVEFHLHLSDQIIQGGSGMRADNTDNPTKICPQQYFKILK